VATGYWGCARLPEYGPPLMTAPVRVLLADRDYRRFWIAQMLYGGMIGTMRFTFVWLVVTLTDWPSAEGLVAIALGMPAMLLSLPAGAWSDRVDRKRLFMVWTGANTGALAVFTVVIAAGWATTFWAAIAAVVIGTTITINPPNLQAMVPLLVSPERLMNAVALQNGASQAASFAGLAFGGIAIRLFGDAGGFGLLTVASLFSMVLMRRVHLPPTVSIGDEVDEGIWQSIKSGARFGFSAEPVRTLLLLALVLGISFSVMQVSMPRVVEDVYGRGPASAGIVLSAFGVGMFASSAFLAGRKSMRHGVNLAIYIGVGLGLGQFLLSLATNFWTAIVVMFGWGINAGIAMTSHRTLIQSHTPVEMMGRVMGIMMVGFIGGLPVGALAASLLAGPVGPLVTMRIVGLATIGFTILLTWRRSIIALR